jgi:hypothetical protein
MVMLIKDVPLLSIKYPFVLIRLTLLYVLTIAGNSSKNSVAFRIGNVLWRYKLTAIVHLFVELGINVL